MNAINVKDEKKKQIAAINYSIQKTINIKTPKNNHGSIRLRRWIISNKQKKSIVRKTIHMLIKFIKKIRRKSEDKDKIDYHEMLLERGLSKYDVQGLPPYRNSLNKAQKFIDQKITVSIGKQNIIGLVILFSLASAVMSILIPLSSNTTHRTEEKVIKINADKSIQQKEETTIKESINSTYYFYLLVFDGDIFRNSILFSAFVLAFFRWQVGNRQSAMSEIFERKRSMNLHIINNESDIKDMISGAISNSLNIQDVNKETTFEKERAIELLEHFLMNNPHGKKEAGFKQRMFVYMELDNIEFALIKYHAGHLDAEQMFRACEIFESRCQSAFFRHLAINQGLAYYTRDFHKLICILMIFGYANSNDNNGNPS